MRIIKGTVKNGLLTIASKELEQGDSLFIIKGENILNSHITRPYNAMRPLSFGVSQIEDGAVEVVVHKAKEKVPGNKGYPKKESQYADKQARPAKFPVDSKEHVHAAISYFSKGHFGSASEKKSTARRILSAAKKFGVNVSKDSAVYKAAHGGE